MTARLAGPLAPVGEAARTRFGQLLHAEGAQPSTTLDDPVQQTDRPLAVFLVRARSERDGQADPEPIILIDLALAHRYRDVCQIEVLDPPLHPEQDAAPDGPRPVRLIDAREAPLYPRARRAAIVRDRRTRQPARR